MENTKPATIWLDLNWSRQALTFAVSQFLGEKTAFWTKSSFWTVFRPISKGMAKKQISNTKDLIFC